MQRLFPALVLAGFASLCCACSYEPIRTSRTVDKREIIGNYTYAKNGGGEVTLRLRADGSFNQTVRFEKSNDVIETTGTWRIENAYLILDGLWISDPRDPASQKMIDGTPPNTMWWIVEAPHSACRLYGGDCTEAGGFEYVLKAEDHTE